MAMFTTPADWVKRLYKLIFSVRHGFWMLGYAVLGMLFDRLEEINVKVDAWVFCSLDGRIPFINVFVIPYIFWFWYVAAVAVVLVLKDKQGMYKFCATIYSGMLVSFLIYWLIPHGQPLRVNISETDPDVFNRLVRYIYEHDTPTNTLPSIHVLNSIATDYALRHSPFFQNKPGLRAVSFAASVLIIMSTVLIKQHSILDVFAAF
ncbi:MAG: phosphatase PAP2 family protein, partial [Oscillospiraceae bacterium]|nr:phosphatase PAP2 family protein [Oscillospiraceae bacterium]